MKKLKYIILKSGSPILFGDASKHSEVARKENVQSAGFCFIQFKEDKDAYDITCFGESTSLGIKSNPEEDAKAISFLFNCYF